MSDNDNSSALPKDESYYRRRVLSMLKKDQPRTTRAMARLVGIKSSAAAEKADDWYEYRTRDKQETAFKNILVRMGNEGLIAPHETHPERGSPQWVLWTPSKDERDDNEHLASSMFLAVNRAFGLTAEDDINHFDTCDLQVNRKNIQAFTVKLLDHGVELEIEAAAIELKYRTLQRWRRYKKHQGVKRPQLSPIEQRYADILDTAAILEKHTNPSSAIAIGLVRDAAEKLAGTKQNEASE